MVNEVERLYASLPSVDCQRKCQEACGPILLGSVEMDRIKAWLGKPLPERTGLTCPLLSILGDCRVYDVRPAICRLYGVVRAMECPHGCVPDRWVSDLEAHKLIRALMDLSDGEIVLMGQSR